MATSFRENPFLSFVFLLLVASATAQANEAAINRAVSHEPGIQAASSVRLARVASAEAEPDVLALIRAAETASAAPAASRRPETAAGDAALHDAQAGSATAAGDVAELAPAGASGSLEANVGGHVEASIEEAIGKRSASTPVGPVAAKWKTVGRDQGFEPQWVTEELFEAQLLKVHGKVLDPKLGLFGPDSMMWKMSQYIVPGGVGAGRALLLQISHPWVTAGIDEHSITRKDPLKRARNTFSYILSMTFGSREQALAAARDVRTIHGRVQGHLRQRAGTFAEGSEYRASEIQAMLWVHATLWETLMLSYEQSVGKVSDDDKLRFYEETKLFAYLFGIPEEALPSNWWAFLEYCDNMRASGQLVATPASQQLAKYLFGWHGVLIWLPMQYAKLSTAANMEEPLRSSYGFTYGPVKEFIYESSTLASRVGHKVMPDFLLENPVYKEAHARVRGKRAWPFTRFQLWLAFGESSLVP
ncbi:MAG: oxygenase MpaB family protein [Moraxellaceae bacterium]|nr:oxygenase MpaB family protein [Moraxellaceae bacterium]